MNNFTFENQGTNTYLVYAIGAEDSVDTMSLGMLTNNKIPGLAPAIFTQMDTNKFIKYNVSSRISVKQFFSGPVNKKRLIGVFNGIVDAMLSAEDYMIDVNTILMDLDYIFADVSTCETFLICLPLANTENNGVNLGVFFKNIMFSTQFDQTENCDHVAKIMNYLNSTPVFSLVDFKELLHNIDTVPQVVAQPVSQPVVNKQPTATQHPQPQTSVQAQPSVKPVNQEQPKVTVSQPVVSKPTPPVSAPTPVAQVEEKSVQTEKKMTMMDLLMHYSKENAAIYKAQKEAEKTGKATKTAVEAPTKTNSKNKSGNPPVQPVGFAVPGQSAPAVGFAVPGQSNAVVTPNPKPSPVGLGAKLTNKSVTVEPVATPAPVPAPAPAPTPTYQPPVIPQGQAMNFGETTVLGVSNIGETTVLGATSVAVQEEPHLIRIKNNEKIALNKPVFRVGKEKSYVDYFIGDNTAISRSHANFISRDGQYFVTDTNSTNHTYINGGMIQSNVETKLTHGDKVRLANEEFEFKLY